MATTPNAPGQALSAGSPIQTLAVPLAPGASASSPLVIQVVSTPDPDAYQKLTALSTPTLAVIAGYIAWRQWKTSRQALKNALFDRRFAIYVAATNLSLLLQQNKQVTDSELKPLMEGLAGIEFLFNTEVARLGQDLRRHAARRMQLQADAADPGQSLYNQAEAATTRTDYEKELRWFGEQSSTLDRLMGGYLRVTH